VDARVILRNFRRLAGHPWIASKLVKLEAEKTFFNLSHPYHRGGEAGKIRQVSLRITDLCNLRCRTCGQWGESGFLIGDDLKRRRQEEVPPSRYLRVLADLIRNGHRPLVYIWGGEPMLYGGILDLMGSITSLRLPVSIATNGTRLAESAEPMVKTPLFLLQVSVDGHCAELHNRLRPSAGNGDNFDQVVKGLDSVRNMRRLLGSTLPLIASLTVISRENAAHLEDIYEAFRHRVDLFVFYLSWWIDEEHAALHEKDFCRRFGKTPSRHRGWIGTWRPEDFELLDRQIRRLLSRAGRASSPPITMIPAILGASNLRKYYSEHGERFGFDQCVSIHQTVEINSNGDLSPCRDYPDYVVGNVKESTITELWNSQAYRAFRRSLAGEGLMPVCSRCCGLMGY
jgi:radical SAM protein with 4Fe4S-binding SPASM domain